MKQIFIYKEQFKTLCYHWFIQQYLYGWKYDANTNP